MSVKGSPWASRRTAGPQALRAGSVESRKQEVPLALEQPGEVDSSLKWAWVEQATLYRKLSQLRNEQPGSDERQGKLEHYVGKKKGITVNCLACLGRVLATQTPNILHPNENLAALRGWEGEGEAGCWYVDRGKPFTVCTSLCCFYFWTMEVVFLNQNKFFNDNYFTVCHRIFDVWFPLKCAFFSFFLFRN